MTRRIEDLHRAKSPQMTVPQVGFAACLGMASMVVLGVFKESSGFAILLLVMAGMWLYMGALQASVHRHKVALQWFTDHVYQDPVAQGAHPAPEELRDIVEHD